MKGLIPGRGKPLFPRDEAGERPVTQRTSFTRTTGITELAPSETIRASKLAGL